MDDGEKGIAGMPVSNGIDIALTDRDGRWRLAVGSDTALFVLPRGGWAPPVNERNLPQFHYLRKEKGSPKTRYPGSASTGLLPESIDFPLHPIEDGERFSILVFGDPQPRLEEHVDFLARDVVAEVARVEGKAFGISLGDIVSDDLSLYDSVNDAFSHIGLPWYNVMGNHDLNFDVERDEDSDETFESVYGPPNYAFQYGKVHFLVLDNVIYGGADLAARIRSGEVKDRRSYVGGFREDQFAFMENYLKLAKRDELIVLCMHIPLFQRRTSYYERIESFRKEDRERLFALLEGFSHTLSLSAHTHFQKQYFFGPEDGWRGDGEHHHLNLGTTCGDWFKGLPTYDGFPDATMRDGTPNGYAVIDFDGNGYAIRYQVAGAPSSKRMSLYVPYPWEKDSEKADFLYANFYMGSKYTKGYCRFGEDGDWQTMERSYEPDPRSLVHFESQRTFLENADEKVAVLYKTISKPQPCDHLWKCPIPENLGAGFHLAEVKMVDRLGAEFFESIVFRIE